MVIAITHQAVQQFGLFLVIAVSFIVPSVRKEHSTSVRSQIRKHHHAEHHHDIDLCAFKI